MCACAHALFSPKPTHILAVDAQSNISHRPPAGPATTYSAYSSMMDHRRRWPAPGHRAGIDELGLLGLSGVLGAVSLSALLGLLALSACSARSACWVSLLLLEFLAGPATSACSASSASLTSSAGSASPASLAGLAPSAYQRCLACWRRRPSRRAWPARHWRHGRQVEEVVVVFQVEAALARHWQPRQRTVQDVPGSVNARVVPSLMARPLCRY